MDINTLRGILTVLSFVIFVGIVWWAWSGRQRKRFEEAAHLPFEERDDLEPFPKKQATGPRQPGAGGQPGQRAGPTGPAGPGGADTKPTRKTAE